MTITEPLTLAVATLKSAITWTWSLRMDEYDFYRWYLDGVTATELRGCTAAQAEAALRRFVEHSLRGELEIVYTPEEITR